MKLLLTVPIVSLYVEQISGSIATAISKYLYALKF